MSFEINWPLVASNYKWKMGQIFVPNSEYLTFTWLRLRVLSQVKTIITTVKILGKTKYFRKMKNFSGLFSMKKFVMCQKCKKSSDYWLSLTDLVRWRQIHLQTRSFSHSVKIPQQFVLWAKTRHESQIPRF